MINTLLYCVLCIPGSTFTVCFQCSLIVPFVKVVWKAKPCVCRDKITSILALDYDITPHTNWHMIRKKEGFKRSRQEREDSCIN